MSSIHANTKSKSDIGLKGKSKKLKIPCERCLGKNKLSEANFSVLEKPSKRKVNMCAECLNDFKEFMKNAKDSVYLFPQDYVITRLNLPSVKVILV